MRTVTIEPDFASWRDAARALLAEKVVPGDVLWVCQGDESEGMLAFDEPLQLKRESPRLKVPRDFARLAESVSCHRSGDQWPLLYQLLWAVTQDKDRYVMRNQTDPTVRSLEQMRKTVSRDIHKMRAFVRFRQVEDGANGLESYVAWYEPEHLIVRVNTPFFRNRFAGMNWSILTPDACVHWDGQSIHHTDGVDQSQAPDGDVLEELWRVYYRSIFNPARIKIKMMQTEMPKKYWKNLPEAEIIEDLIQGSGERVLSMLKQHQRPLKPAPQNNYMSQLDRLNRRSSTSVQKEMD